MIHLLRQLTPRANQLAEEIGNHLFMRHCKDHVASTTILESPHLGSDLVVTARLAPEVGRMHHGHQHLLGADRVHLFANHLGDVHVDAHPERQEGVDSRAERPNVAGAQQEAMRWHLRVGGVLAQRRKEERSDPHG